MSAHILQGNKVNFSVRVILNFKTKLLPVQIVNQQVDPVVSRINFRATDAGERARVAFSHAGRHSIYVPRRDNRLS